MQHYRQYRDRLSINISVMDGNSHELVGHVWDVSPDGVSLFGRGVPGIREEMDMWLGLPWPVEGCDRIKIHGHRCWMKRMPGGRWRAGYKITESDPEQEGVLEKITFRFASGHTPI